MNWWNCKGMTMKKTVIYLTICAVLSFTSGCATNHNQAVPPGYTPTETAGSTNVPTSLKGANMQSSLTQRQQSIVGIAANTAAGNLELLKHELNSALDAGMSINEVKEILVHLYAYAGFPRSLRGLWTLTAVVAERQAKGIQDPQGREASPITDAANKYERGKRILETLTKIPESPSDTPPEIIDVFLKEHLFADIFERDILTFEERELATISALTALDGVEPMRLSHTRIGMNLGLTEAQIRELTSIVNASKSTIFPKGAIASTDLFNGTAYVNMLVPKDETGHYSVGDVVFEPGCRNNWHAHSAGQILLVTEGRGFYQERGKTARPLVKGDVVVIPSGVQHWHGATRDSRFVHLAVTGIGGSPDAGGWFEPVSDEDYNKAHQ
jgi:quercetin dioxygenase-like cupin family protein/alkylhydroperoxidase/carboxymuconolactone decarboxylase family protein YurZ